MVCLFNEQNRLRMQVSQHVSSFYSFPVVVVLEIGKSKLGFGRDLLDTELKMFFYLIELECTHSCG